MDTPIIIRDKEFKYKKDALLYFKNILGSYEFGEILNNSDQKDLIALLLQNETRKDKIGSGVKEIRIGKVQYGTKCFEINRNDLSIETFSYILCINGDRSPLTMFNAACRNAVDIDMRTVKQKYFDEFSIKGKVKCQETGILSSWSELNVDHRQPNTLSVILDRFIELNDIDIKQIKFTKTANNKIAFEDEKLSENFRKYHKQKATLRIVRKENNLSRTFQARIKTQKKDLTIE